MSYRDVRKAKEFGESAFYLASLQYGHYLWLEGYAGRSLLALTRALYADVPEQDPVLKDYPLPYSAIYWLVSHHPSEDFPGNPRVSFQHQATRIEGAREELRRARAWAVWYLVGQAKPSLPGDPTQAFEEPGLAAIEAGLRRWGHGDELHTWRNAPGGELNIERWMFGVQ